MGGSRWRDEGEGRGFDELVERRRMIVEILVVAAAYVAWDRYAVHRARRGRRGCSSS
jgi:hypothetical protein